MAQSGPASLGRYVIEAPLGRGAMGLVYRAQDPRLHRAVALKTLAPGLLAGEKAQVLKERFLNEGRAAGRLRHRAIVAVYDADEDPATGTAYLAMELIEGEDLRARMKRGMGMDELVEILAEVADALDHAHDRGVIHRDVKPANVLLDAVGRPHLTDFGIARLGDSTLTQDGEFLGTPAYMAPEQVRARPVSPQTDVYALGVVLYEGLTRRRPFEGDSMVATATSIVTDRPALPSEAGFPSTAFDAVVGRALEKEPGNRHPSAGEFAADMLKALALHRDATATSTVAPRTASAAAPKPSAPAPLSRPRRRTAVIAGGLVLLALAGIVAFVLLRGAAPGTSATDGGSTASPSQEAPVEPPAGATAGAEAPPPAPAKPAPAAAQGTVSVEATSPKLGAIVVRKGEREIARIPLAGKRKGLKALQVEAEGSFRLPAGDHELTLAFVPEDGRTLTDAQDIHLDAGGRVVVLVDVGTFGRALQVKLKPAD